MAINFDLLYVAFDEPIRVNHMALIGEKLKKNTKRRVLKYVSRYTLTSRINVHARLFFSWFFPSLHALITPARFYFFPEFWQPAHF